MIENNFKNSKQYHSIRKIQKKYEILLKIAQANKDLKRQEEIMLQLKVVTECLKALSE